MEVDVDEANDDSDHDKDALSLDTDTNELVDMTEVSTEELEEELDEKNWTDTPESASSTVDELDTELKLEMRESLDEAVEVEGNCRVLEAQKLEVEGVTDEVVDLCPLSPLRNVGAVSVSGSASSVGRVDSSVGELNDDDSDVVSGSVSVSGVCVITEDMDEVELNEDWFDSTCPEDVCRANGVEKVEAMVEVGKGLEEELTEEKS